ncbi:MAG: hypothetical protein IT582_06830 [Opitutaceae bacterium]|nr:hypothetical protein [Opitutaceae bacterium]
MADFKPQSLLLSDAPVLTPPFSLVVRLAISTMTAMKLLPPAVVVDDQAPFKDALFGRKDFAESLTSLLRNVEEGLVIFLHAPWGEGKTTFAQMWRAFLRGQKLEVIYFDAYASDYFDDPFVSFSGEILELVDKRLAAEGIAEPRREFKKTAVEVGKRLAGLGAKVGLRALTLGAVESGHLGELKEIGTELATGASEIGADVIEKRIEHYTTEKDALKSFKRSLAKLAAVVREKQGFPLTIVVDELDRCRPDFALGLLERIKHLFDVEGIAFILLVNRDQIESYVRTVYGETVDARAYLLKFGNLFVDLPSHQPGEYEGKGRDEFCRRLFQHYDLPVSGDDSDILGRSVNLFVRHFELTLREIERMFALLALYYGSRPKNQLTHGLFIALLTILKVKEPTLYRLLATQSISAGKFLSETRLDLIEKSTGNGVDRTWMLDILNFCLLTDEELAKIPEEIGPRRMGSWLFRYNMDRRRVIPFFCGRIDRFSLQPGT